MLSDKYAGKIQTESVKISEDRMRLKKKYMAKKLLLTAAAGSMLFVMSGCNKAKAAFTPDSPFAYTNIQETKYSYEEELQPDEYAEENSDEIMPDEMGPGAQDTRPDGTDPNRAMEYPMAQIKAKDNPSNNSPSADTPSEGTPAGGDSSPASGAPSEGTGDGPGDGSGSGEGPGSGTGDSPGGDQKKEEEKKQEEPKKDEKSYGLEYEGDLGRYIWGETPDTSKLKIYYTAEGGRKEIKDYKIEMDYPELRSAPTISNSNKNTLVVNTYDPGSRIATVTYGKYYCQVPYELDVAYVALDFEITNYCTDPSHRADIATDDEGFATEKYSVDGLWNDTYDFSGAFPGYTYCKYCSGISSSTNTESVRYEETIDGMTYVKYKDVDITSYSCWFGKWTVLYPMYNDYSFTRDEFNQIGVQQDYETSIEYYYDTLSVDKNSMMSVEWAGDYNYSAGTYAKFRVVAPEGVDLNWAAY